MHPHKYLVKVEYIQEKKEIICYFKDAFSQSAIRFSFKPHFYWPKIEGEKLNCFLKSIGAKNFFVEEKKDSSIVFSDSFQNLKNISNGLAVFTGKKALVLEPERQFLIEKDWSYFDSFIFQNNIPEKVFSKKDFSFFLIPEINFFEALRIDKNQVFSIIKKSVLSNLLKLSLNKIPLSIEEQTEYFLENIYFKFGKTVNWQNESGFFSCKEFAPHGFFDNLSEIDFSFVWLQSFSKNFFNLSQETMNCSCCAPIRIDDANLLPSSMIEIIPKENNLFYISTSNYFANFFHHNNPKKDLRKNKRKEFLLKSFPIGPLFDVEKYLIPLDDAIILLNEKKIVLSKNHSLFWFCSKKESFFSKELNNINQELFILNSKLKDYSSNLLFEESFDFLFNSFSYDSLKRISSEIPFQLKKPFSKFFSISLAKSINAIQESILFKFKDFSEKKGHRVVYSNGKNVFVTGNGMLSLAKTFSRELKLPQPIVSNFSKKTVFK